jgi:PBP1b-binding outer membrane lipoprotein LpoB
MKLIKIALITAAFMFVVGCASEKPAPAPEPVATTTSADMTAKHKHHHKDKLGQASYQNDTTK